MYGERESSPEQRLRDKDIAEAVDGQAGEEVCLSENQTAAGKIRPHDGAAVFDSVAQAALKKGFAEIVVGVAGDQAKTDF